jgi:hypothetical protein
LGGIRAGLELHARFYAGLPISYRLSLDFYTPAEPGNPIIPPMFFRGVIFVRVAGLNTASGASFPSTRVFHDFPVPDSVKIPTFRDESGFRKAQC